MKRYYAITFPGVIFAGITVVVFLAAINSQANVLFFAFGLMVGALFLSAFFSTLMLNKVDVRREVAEHAEVGQQLEVRYQLTSRNRLWPGFAIHITEAAAKGALARAPRGYCVHLAPQGTAQVTAQMAAGRRGELKLERIKVACCFPFGLVRRVVHVAQQTVIVVYPRVGTVERAAVMHSRAAAATDGAAATQARGGNDEVYGLREYRAGDNVKQIHWRRTARTGQVVVREMTHASPPRMMVVVDVREWREVSDGVRLAEEALEVAASLVCQGILQNHAVGLCIAGGKEEYAEPRTGKDARDRALRALAMVELNELMVEGRGARAQEAEWVVVSLRAGDTAGDVTPPGVKCTRLTMEGAGAKAWVRFEGEGGQGS